MRVASLNLNKRLGNASARSRLLHWLLEHEVSLLLAQEPYSHDGKPPSLDGFRPVGGNQQVFAWVVEHLGSPSCTLLESWWQWLEVGYLAVHNVYLNAYSRRRRAYQLEELHGHLLSRPERPILIVGDFNLAPRPEDGRFDVEASRFNSEVDRAPFRQLLVGARLRDLTKASSPEYTIVRKYRGRDVKFRCDLALASDYVASAITARYDHAPRVGSQAFTDHSAVVLELPVTLRGSNTQQQRRGQGSGMQSADSVPGPAYQPHKTAVSRCRPSPFARSIEKSRQLDGIRSVLDYGCGRGADVHFYRRIGLIADGYDPHPSFGWHAQPHGAYDLVTIIFVLNVLPNPWERFIVLRNASRHLADGGCMLVACRSPRAIERIASRRRWPRHNDGYWSSERKGTFQRGISTQELVLMAGRIGLVSVQEGGDRWDTTRVLFARSTDDFLVPHGNRRRLLGRNLQG
jgi:hypothetical protein